jgi:uncharacterized protein (DUF58 family)
MKWFIGVLLLLLTALVLESGLLAYATYVLLGLLVVSRVLARSWTSNLSATRLMYPAGQRPQEEENREEEQAAEAPAGTIHAEIGDRVTVRLKVRNAGWLPVPWMLLEDLVPLEGLKKDARLKLVRGRQVQLRMLRPGGEAVLRYQLECLRRGYYQIGPLVIENGDLFGLHRRYRVETQPGYLLVYPRQVQLAGYELASRRPIGDVRLTHRLYEDPTRIAGVRAYQPGDPLNRVHWKATARTGTLHSKVHEPSTLAGATVVLDFHEDGYHSRGEPFRSELAVTTALSLVNAVFEMGQQVGLVTNGRDAAERLRLDWQSEQHSRRAAHEAAAMRQQSERLQPLQVETRRSSEQLQRVRELLARVELTGGLTFSQLVGEALPRLPRDATVIAVLPQVSVETALTLGTLRRRGFAVTAVLVLLENDKLELAQARLLAEGVRDLLHVHDEAELPELCRRQIEHLSLV